tara:strand:+ start:293 stop:694 length:402 start_codon:yes stop_codon:yes gene_type:complete
MGIKDVFNQAPTLEEEALYKQVLDEVESGVMRKGIYAKALADGLGDEGKAQSLYIKYRVQSLVDEQRGKAEQLGIELTAKAKAKKAKKKTDTQRANELDWERTPWYEKFIMYIIIMAILIPAYFWITHKLFGW